MTLFFIVLYGSYAMLVLLLVAGWRRTMRQRIPDAVVPTGISIVVAVRNEAANLPQLLESFRHGHQSSQYSELIIVDDHSTDESRAIVAHFSATVPSVTWLPSPGEGKKAAIAAGVAHARFDIIATTDADCLLPATWHAETSKRMSDETLHMLVGPVKVDGPGFFSALQSTEFCSLAGTAGATLGFGIPSMCNGANLIYRKSSFIAVNGFAGNESISSGDDEFLMRKFHSTWPGSVRYLNSSQAVVTTAAHRTPGGFFSQRMRWAGKWRPDFSLTTTWTALAVWLIHTGFIAFLTTALSGAYDWRVVIILLLSKLLAEAVFLYPVSGFLQARWNWFSFLLLQFIYSFYVVFVGFLSLFVKVRWKGRVVRTKV